MNKFKEKFKEFKSTWKNKLAMQGSAAVENANIGVIFLLALLKALAGVGAFITLPIAMGASAVSSILSIRQAYLKRKEGKSNKAEILNAVVTTSVSALIITAIILTFVAVGVVAPAILCGALGLKALYEAGEAIWCVYKYLKNRHTDPLKARKYAHKALEHAIAFLIEAGAAAAVAMVLIAHKSSFGALGVVIGAVGAACAVYGGVKLYKKYKKKVKSDMQHDIEEIIGENPTLDNELTNNALLHARVGNVLSQVAEERGIDLNTELPLDNQPTQTIINPPYPAYVPTPNQVYAPIPTSQLLYAPVSTAQQFYTPVPITQQVYAPIPTTQLVYAENPTPQLFYAPTPEQGYMSGPSLPTYNPFRR